MGNRAVVSFKGTEFDKAAVYLHWNGGPESVLAFLDVLRARKWTRMDYISARFVGVVVEFFDHEGDDQGYSVGIVDDPNKWADGCDNGHYIVECNKDDNWLVTQRCAGKTTKYLAGKLCTFAPMLDERQAQQYGSIMDTLQGLRSLRSSKLAG